VKPELKVRSSEDSYTNVNQISRHFLGRMAAGRTASLCLSNLPNPHAILGITRDHQVPVRLQPAA
jgi:hypothetical protein